MPAAQGVTSKEPGARAAAARPGRIAQPFARVSLLRQFLLASVPLSVAVLILAGHQVGERIEAGIVHRTAGIVAVYFESMLAPRLGRFAAGEPLDADIARMLDGIFVDGPLARRVVRFKLWAPDGSIHYSSDHDQVGLRFPLHDHHALALSGRMVAAISALDGPDNGPERAQWSRLMEIYIPLRAPGATTVGAIAEFYHEVDSVDAEIATAQRQSWIMIVLGALLLYAVLYVLVLRGSRTIAGQRSRLLEQVRRLEQLLAENGRIHRRLQDAGARSTALAELSLRRIAADLHDGPVQNLAFALLRLDDMVADGTIAAPLRASVRDAMQQLRDIASGLAAPAMTQLNLRDALRRAAADAQALGPIALQDRIADDLPDAPLPVKLTAYRVVREALVNALRHAPGHAVRLSASVDAPEQVLIEVADDGPGFDPAQRPAEGHLGLDFLRERVQLLSGEVEIRSALGQGTTLRVVLPLAAPSAEAGAPAPALQHG